MKNQWGSAPLPRPRRKAAGLYDRPLTTGYFLIRCQGQDKFAALTLDICQG
jgi:hypothetical protein